MGHDGGTPFLVDSENPNYLVSIFVEHIPFYRRPATNTAIRRKGLKGLAKVTYCKKTSVYSHLHHANEPTRLHHVTDTRACRFCPLALAFGGALSAWGR